MGFLSRLFGGDQPARTSDQDAVDRYRHLLRTAPPEQIEQVHREAFSTLTPQQRQLLFDELRANAPVGEAPRSAEPDALAASATRSELKQPGTVERSLAGAQSAFAAQNPGVAGFGGGFGSSMLGSVAGYFAASALMSAFLPMGDGLFGGDIFGADSTDAMGDMDLGGFDL